MNIRQFFASNTWWGKIIGAFLGYLMMGHIGALVGIFIGNIFDRGLAEHFSNPHWHFHSEKRHQVQKVFFETIFSVMGYLAKADGRVTENEIQIAKTLMKEMGLKSKQIERAKICFNEGKKTDFDLRTTLISLQSIVHDNPELVRLFIDIQYRAAQVDGLNVAKQEAFNTMLRYLGFAPLHKQHRFFDDFVYNTYKDEDDSSQQNHQQTHHGILDHAYGILDIPKNASKQDVKRAYRRLMSRNHPDKLIAKGLPEEMIKIANEKTQKIRKAYEKICEAKGWL
jgi:DnaJ like chaperone protein